MAVSIIKATSFHGNTEKKEGKVPAFGEIDKNLNLCLLTRIQEKTGKRAGFSLKKFNYNNMKWGENRFFAENDADFFLFQERRSIIRLSKIER